MDPDSVDGAHSRPDGAGDKLVEAVGALSEAFERIERARGALYSFHQLVGGADAALDQVIEDLAASGHKELADRLGDELVGRNVIEGRWTFQLVEEFDDGYYATWRALERAVRDETMGGRRHVFEAEMKQLRRTSGRAHHSATPGHGSQRAES
jgi:hypothetical protein